MRPTEEQLWRCLSEVGDPEIPTVSVVDLGIVRGLSWHADDHCEVIITPTYSGCPAMQVIAENIEQALKAQGVTHIHIRTQLSPAWTTDWISDKGRENLKAYGIAPPAQQAEQAINISALTSGARFSIRGEQEVDIACPQCGSLHTRLISQFGSTACKALYRCNDCLEPFDYFKPH